ncbi:MAG: xylulokinase [Actinobacteria bacterium]|nr:xylulokinase [Actinomycetota bacterium]
MEHFLGLDIGTSGVRAVAVDAAGERVLAAATVPLALRVPRPGWTEQDPEDWWTASRAVLRRVAAELDGPARGLGLSGQMHGSVFLDAADRVIRPALLWNDQRTAAQSAEIAAAVGGERLMAIAGNPPLTGFQAPKILWLRDEEPEAYGRLRTVLLPKDYVRLRLTGERATDASDASGTLLLDVGARRWSAVILDALAIDPDWLPRVYEGPEPTGALRAEVAAELGLPAGLPVAAGGGDNAAAAVGAGVIDPATLLVSLGTSGVSFAPTAGFLPDPTGRVHAFAHALPDRYHLMAVTLAAGGSLSWWSEVVGETVGRLVEEAAAVAPGAEGTTFLPYLTGDRTPHMDHEVSGAFVGLTARHGRAEMTRAVLEGVAFSLRDGLAIMAGLGVPDGPARAVGGGARSAVWTRILADVLGRPIVRATVDEGPAFGAALLARVAAGGAADTVTAATAGGAPAADPDPAVGPVYDEAFARYTALYPGS